MPADVDVAYEPLAVANYDIRTDDAVRANTHVSPDHRARFYTGGRIDRGHLMPHASIAPTSASATRSPCTFASARNHHMFLLRASF